MSSPLLESIEKHFANITDPRQSRKITHPSLNIIFITLCGVLCGADNWVEIEEFGNSQKEWLQTYLDLEEIPSHDTLGHFFAVLDREEFQKGFRSWVEEIQKTVQGVIAIDGKQMRRSHDKGIGKGAIHMVSAWGCENGLVLGQQKIAEKSNEITAIPRLLEQLDLRGCIITIDAMGCQKEIAQQIVRQKGDYVLSLKGNQGQLHEDVASLFSYFEKTNFVEPTHEYVQTVNKGHGRIEVRECWTFNPHKWSSCFRTLDQWAGLQTVGMVRAHRTEQGQTTSETRFVISSLGLSARPILEATRAHWGIENQLHWVLDVVFKEDLSRVRVGNAAENLSVIRHLALNLIRRDKSKGSTKTKRLRCALDSNFREAILENIHSLC